MTTLSADALRGSITPLITPFRDGAVDYDTYASLVERHIALGGHGVLVNGTSAEPSTLTVAERNRLVDVAIEVGRGRTQIVAATGSQSYAETETLTDHATKAGVDALLIVTPYYIRPPQRGLVEYYVALARRTDVPVMIYHIPVRAAVNVELSTLVEIKSRAANLSGMKHASTDLAFVSDCLARLGLPHLRRPRRDELSDARGRCLRLDERSRQPRSRPGREVVRRRRRWRSRRR
jgi:4-hydroxy-tetrahydrodipicolinate synthase